MLVYAVVAAQRGGTMQVAQFVAAAILAGIAAEVAGEPVVYATASIYASQAREKDCTSATGCTVKVGGKHIYSDKVVASASAQAAASWSDGLMVQSLKARAKKYQGQFFNSDSGPGSSLRDLEWKIEIPGADNDTITPISFKLTVVGDLAGDPAPVDRMEALLYVRDTESQNHWGQFSRHWDGTNTYTEGEKGFASHSITGNGPRGVTFEGVFEVRGAARILDIWASLSTELGYGDADHIGSGSAQYTAILEIEPPPGVIVTP